MEAILSTVGVFAALPRVRLFAMFRFANGKTNLFDNNTTLSLLSWGWLKTEVEGLSDGETCDD